MPISNPYDKAHELARALKLSENYQHYVKAKNLLSLQAREDIVNFRNLQMKLNQAEMLGQKVEEAQIMELSREYARLNQEPLIADFFSAEGMFVQMFTDIQEIIQKALEEGLQD